MKVRYGAWITLGRLALAVVLVIILAYVGRPASHEPEFHPTYRPATEQERLEHDLRQAWELEQLTRR